LQNDVDHAQHCDAALDLIEAALKAFPSEFRDAILVTALIRVYRGRGLADLMAANLAREEILALWSTVDDD
jgi:hypothetical protein